MRNAKLAATITAVSLVALTGCTNASDEATPSATPATTATSSAEAHPQHTEYTFPPKPSWGDEAEAAALATAEEAMHAYFERDRDDWWEHVGPYFTDEAARIYVNTDPRRIPDTKINGTVELIESPSPYLAWVSVPSTVGDWTLLLGCESAGAPWRIHEIQPPEGVN